MALDRAVSLIDLPPFLFHSWTAIGLPWQKTIAVKLEQSRVQPSCRQADVKKRKWGWAKHTHFLVPNSQITGLSPSQEEREYIQCHEKGQEDFSTWNHEMWNCVFPVIKVTLQKRGSCWRATAIAMNLTIPPNTTPYSPIYLAITEAMESVELHGSAIYPTHTKTLGFQSNHLPSAKCLLS